MKTTSLPIKAFLAAIAAIAFLPVGPGAASIAFTVTGLFGILLSDYGREVRPVRANAEVIPFACSGRNLADLNRAA